MGGGEKGQHYQQCIIIIDHLTGIHCIRLHNSIAGNWRLRKIVQFSIKLYIVWVDRTMAMLIEINIINPEITRQYCRLSVDLLGIFMESRIKRENNQKKKNIKQKEKHKHSEIHISFSKWLWMKRKSEAMEFIDKSASEM